MLKHSINKSNNLLNTKETVGRVEFMIGCGDTLFVNAKSAAQNVNDYVKTGKLEDLSGLPFQWWNIWSNDVKRSKREAEEGSGDSEYIYDEDEDDEENLGEDEDDAEMTDS